jgi:predicted nuclease of predicted toxin-antitoxin system
MIVLLDANISWRLVSQLKSVFTDVRHVEKIELNQPAKDSEIWEYAKINDAIIITSDSDFYKLSVLHGFPPKVVILKTGNQSNNYLLEVLIKHASDIHNLYSSSEYGLLEII